MTDLVKRLRDGLIEYPKRWSGDTHSDMGGSVDYDKTYALLDEAANRIEALEAKLAKAVGLLEAWIRVATHCTIEEGVCCCGAAMDTHDDPMSCGHLQVDHGAYVARGLVEETNATLAELTGGKDD